MLIVQILMALLDWPFSKISRILKQNLERSLISSFIPFRFWDTDNDEFAFLSERLKLIPHLSTAVLLWDQFFELRLKFFLKSLGILLLVCDSTWQSFDKVAQRILLVNVELGDLPANPELEREKITFFHINLTIKILYINIIINQEYWQKKIEFFLFIKK